MAPTDVGDYLQLVPTVLRSPHGFIWSSYDEQADVQYVNFRKPAIASDSELREDDIIVRYDGDELIAELPLCCPFRVFRVFRGCIP